MKELHSIQASRGYINIEIDFDDQSLKWLDDNKIFKNRQAAHQRRKRMEKKMSEQLLWNNDAQRYYHELDGGRTLEVDGDAFIEAVHDAIKAEHGDINPDSEGYDKIYDATKEELLDPDMWEHVALEVTPGKRLEDMPNFGQYDAWIIEG